MTEIETEILDAVFQGCIDGCEDVTKCSCPRCLTKGSLCGCVIKLDRLFQFTKPTSVSNATNFWSHYILTKMGC